MIQAGSEGMPDAEIVLSNPLLGLELKMMTTDDGMFSSSTIIPSAQYSLKVSHKGYSAWQSGVFAVSTAQTVRLQITLQPDNVDKPLPSTGEFVFPHDGSAGATDSLSGTEVRGLPGGGRPAELVSLAPAATLAGAAPGMLVVRSQPFANAVLVDGIDTTMFYSQESTSIPRQLPRDSIESVGVIASGLPAESGRSIGGLVNASTRTGGANYHGDLYEYYRNPNLASNDVFAGGSDVRQTQYRTGVNAGGPIMGSDEFFFFVNLEIMNRDAQAVNRITNPLIANPAGTAVLASNCTATAAQCTAAANFLQAEMNKAAPDWEHSDLGFGKLEFRTHEGNTFTLDANASRWHAPAMAETESVAPNGGLIGDPVLHDDVRFAKFGWTSTGATTGNDLRLGWFKDRVAEYPTSPLAFTGFTGINVAGTMAGATQKWTTFTPIENRVQLVENFRASVNRHQFMWGIDVSDTDEHLQSLANPVGLYTYSSLTAFAQDYGFSGLKSYSTFDQTLNQPARTFHVEELNGYFADTWRATGRITLNYVVRYERPFLPTPEKVNTSYFYTGSISSPGLDFAPRIGVAYKLNEQTVVRGGYGYYYAPFSGQLLDVLFLGSGLSQTSITVIPTQKGSPSFPNVIPQSNIPTGSTDLAYVQSKFRNPFTEQANLGIERRIGRHSTLTVGAIEDRGRKMWTTSDANLSVPATTSAQNPKIPQFETYSILNAAGQTRALYTTSFYTAKNDSTYGHLYDIQNFGSTWYYGATAQWLTQLSHGLTVSAAYTWSHATDNLGPGSATGFALMGGTTSDINFDRGASALDQRNRGVIRWTWQPAVAGGSSASRLVNGWTVSGIATGASAQSVTPLVLIQGQQFSSGTMLYTTSLSGSGGWARAAFDPIGSLHTASQYSLDARVARTFPVTAHFKGTLAIEVFNLLDRQPATMLNNLAYVSTEQFVPGSATNQVGYVKPVAGAGTGIASRGSSDGTNARRCQIELRISF
ncbi:MAG TPA: hypothetical protein VKF41_10935 [Bryobacteraceae bacterium]|nr:hypothetical protein [Bryobacteraceae bacterium]